MNLQYLLPKVFNTQYYYLCIIYIYTVTLGWVRSKILNPLNNYIDLYLKCEPPYPQWLSVYCMNVSFCETMSGIDKSFYGSDEIYYIPFIEDFSIFVNDHYQEFCLEKIKTPKYDPDTKQIPHNLETLVVTKNNRLYTFRSLPQNLKKPLIPQKYNYEETLSNIEFVYITYSHPSMIQSIQLSIPEEYYVIGNELFTPAFIQRELELQKEYYVFDSDYSIEILDHECEQQTLKYTDYMIIQLDSYELKKIPNLDTNFDFIVQDNLHEIQSDSEKLREHSNDEFDDKTEESKDKIDELEEHDEEFDLIKKSDNYSLNSEDSTYGNGYLSWFPFFPWMKKTQ